MMAAYTEFRQQAINDGYDWIKNYGVGDAYDFSSVAGDVLYTRTENAFNQAAIDSYAMGVLLPVTASSSLYTNYMYLKGSAQLNNSVANKIGVTYDYRINKNLDVYVSCIYQAAGDADENAYISGADSVSSGKGQSALHVGVRFYYE